MFYGPYLIQWAALFTVFLIWFLGNFPETLYRVKSITKKNTDPNRAAVTAADVEGTTAVTTDNTTARHTGVIGVWGARSERSNRALFEGFVMLAIGVILNFIALGNRTAGDVFACVAMVALFLNSVLHWAGVEIGGHILWILAHLAIFGLYLTPWCTSNNPIFTNYPDGTERERV